MLTAWSRSSWACRLHQFAFVVSIPAGVALLVAAGTTPARIAAAVYALSLAGLYGTSAAFHLGRWSAAVRQRMDQADHAMIYVLIAGTYTPFALLALGRAWGLTLLVVVWAVALGGIAVVIVRHRIRLVGITLYRAAVDALAASIRAQALAVVEEGGDEVGDPGWGAHRPGGLRLADPPPPRPEATFVFVDDPAEVPQEATPFDMRGAELGHHGGDCSFETILRRYQLDDPVLWDIARIVHEADLADDRYHAPEAPGLDVLCRGLSMVADDEQTLAVTGPLFDGLYEHRRRALLLGRDPA
jgi:hypothetical protein